MRNKGLLIASGIFVLVMAGLISYSFLSPARLSSPRAVIIPKGATASGVARILGEAGVIENPALFKLAIRLKGAANSIQAGTYRFEPGIRNYDILKDLEEGRTARIRVLIREGATLGNIASALENAKVANSKDFLRAASSQPLLDEFKIPGKSFEGYLFPDTYDFALDADPEEIIRSMASAFFRRIAGITKIALSPEELNSKVILASIVEREYRVASEAPLIASVFVNRLSMRMALQSCATVVYILTEKMGKPHPETVLYSDLEIKDSYNTYRNRGLPPGPISNPGETALRAVFNPAKSDYLYFRLADGASGAHRFSRTFEEHTQAAIPVKGF